MGHEGGVLAVAQAEDGAVGGDGHGDDHRVDAYDEGVEAQCPEEVVDGDGQQGEAQEGGEVDGAVAQEGAEGELRHGGADDEQGGGHGDVANHGEGLADPLGDALDAQGDDEHGEISSEHGRAPEHFLLELRSVDGLARDEDGADGEDGEGVDHVEHGGIEHGFVSEDAGDDGIAHEADVAEHHGEAYHALIILLLRQQSGQPEGDAREQHVGEGADAEQGEDVAAVGQLACHGRGEDEGRAGDVDDELGEALVERPSHVVVFACDESHHHNGKERQHYLDDHTCSPMIFSIQTTSYQRPNFLPHWWKWATFLYPIHSWNRMLSWVRYSSSSSM